MILDCEERNVKTPAVTVLMSVYNGMPYLPEAVASILSQTIDAFQFVIVDDGSTDASRAYLTQLKDPRLCVIRLDKNYGQGAARNVGLRWCTTEFTALMDADDVSLPTRFKTQLHFLAENRDVGAVGTLIAYYGSAGLRGFCPHLPTEHSKIYEDLFHGKHAICHPTLMCRTRLLQQIGGYRVSRSGEDWDLLLRLGEMSKLANVSEVLHLYRAHPGNVNVKHIGEIRRQIAYACHCATQRLSGRPEAKYQQFCRMQNERWRVVRAIERIETYSLKQYRLAIGAILAGRPIAGYARLGLASLCSPRRTVVRLSQTLRRCIRSPRLKRTDCMD